MIERFLAIGPSRHGVVRHVRALASAADVPVIVASSSVPMGATVHLDLTDRLLASRSCDAQRVAAVLFDRLAERQARVVLGLHDIPDGTGSPWSTLRISLYRYLADRAAAVVVCSDTERALLQAQGVRARAVLPLPVPGGVPTAAAQRVVSVTVLGYLWPGRGHKEVLAALPTGLRLICAGGPAAGHDQYAADLAADPRVTVTGYLPDVDIAALLSADTIPVAPNRALAASASICDWWARGRRPLAPATTLTRELVARHPGSLLLYDDLGAVLADVRSDPSMTDLPPGLDIGPDVRAAAAARLAVGR